MTEPRNHLRLDLLPPELALIVAHGISNPIDFTVEYLGH